MGRTSVLVTCLVGSFAAGLALAAVIRKRLEKSSKVKEEDLLVAEHARNPNSVVHRRNFFSEQADSHVRVTSAAQCQWSDDYIGVRLLFAPSALQLVHEERHFPVIVLKFAVQREPEARVQVVFEWCEETKSPDQYRKHCVENVGDVSYVTSSSTARIGGDVFPAVEYNYLSETNTIIYVVSVFLTHKQLGISLQYCSPAPIPKTLPTAFYELVRTIKLADAQASPSFLFCAEPRLGIGFRVPLDFELKGPAGGHESFQQPFATLSSAKNAVTIVGFHAHHPNVSWEVVAEREVTKCFNRFAVHGSLPIAFDQPGDSSKCLVMRSCTILAASDIEFGWGDGEEKKPRELTGYFCFHEVKVKASESGDVGFESFSDGLVNAYFCLYCLSVGGGEYVALLFLSPRTHQTLHTFVSFCQNVASSISLGNHYGQETSLTYCCLRHFCRFRVNISNQIGVREPSLGDPVSLFRLAGVNDSVVMMRIVPGMNYDAFEPQFLQCVRQLGGCYNLLEHRRSTLVSLGAELFLAVHRHDFSVPTPIDDDDIHLDNWLSHYDDDQFEPHDTKTIWVSAAVCFHNKTFIFQTVSNEYCLPEAKKVIDEIISGFSPF